MPFEPLVRQWDTVAQGAGRQVMVRRGVPRGQNRGQIRAAVSRRRGYCSDGHLGRKGWSPLAKRYIPAWWCARTGGRWRLYRRHRYISMSRRHGVAGGGIGMTVVWPRGVLSCDRRQVIVKRLGLYVWRPHRRRQMLIQAGGSALRVERLGPAGRSRHVSTARLERSLRGRRCLRGVRFARHAGCAWRIARRVARLVRR